jgi:WD40 repeat protein
VRLWDTATATEVWKRPLADEWGFSVAFSPDGKTLAVASANYLTASPSRGRVVLLSVSHGKILRQLTEGDYHPTEAVAYSPDGKRLATAGGHDCTLRLWDPATGHEIRPVVGHQGLVLTAVFTADARRVITSGGDDTTRVWDTATGRELHHLPGHTAHLLPDDKTVVTTAGWDRPIVHTWNTVTGKERRRFALPGSAWAQAVDRAGTQLAAADKSHLIRLYDLATGKECGRLTGHTARVRAMEFSPDGQWLASASGEERKVRLWNVATRQETRSFEAGDVFSVAFSPDGALLAAGGDDSGVRLWDLVTGRERLRLTNDKTFWTRACCVRFSPDGRTLATGSMHGLVYLWEVATGKQRLRPEGVQDWTGTLAFSRDGRYLITGGSDTAALVWDLRAVAGATPRLAEGELKALWADLAGDDAAKAYRAVLCLAAAPEQAVPFLNEALAPVPRADEGRIARLVADLDADDFTTRTRASAELAKLGEAAVAPLRKALAGKPSAELRRRCEQLLAPWDNLLPSGEPLRALRAVEALEQAGTKEARALLQRLAGGAEGAGLTREARASLARLRR